ncbi:MAG: hypothetical protein P8J59_09325 [Phycisphaerales bacterium]|jgi:hypothetical protein|nr:hypothetical protein [Phycisphaerales bacterium]
MAPSLRRIFATLLALVFPIVASAGCSSTSSRVDSDGLAQDSVIDATVMVGDGLGLRIERDPGAWPVQLRPARAIVLPDGVLRADVGADLGVDDRPGMTRSLYRSQLVELWKEMDVLDFGTPSAGNYSGNLELLEPGDDEVIQILHLQRDGRDWTIVRRFEIPEDASPRDSSTFDVEDPRMRSAMRRLAALAWAWDVPPDDSIRFPERYDFGPDPWSRYREDESLKESS